MKYYELATKCWEAFVELVEYLWELLKHLVNQMIKTIRNIYKAILEEISKDSESLKYMRIYNRTKNKRIKKKQLSKIKKRLKN